MHDDTHETGVKAVKCNFVLLKFLCITLLMSYYINNKGNTNAQTNRRNIRQGKKQLLYKHSTTYMLPTGGARGVRATVKIHCESQLPAPSAPPKAPRRTGA